MFIAANGYFDCSLKMKHPMFIQGDRLPNKVSLKGMSRSLILVWYSPNTSNPRVDLVTELTARSSYKILDVAAKSTSALIG